ncbi:hypothetical protein CDAR_10881 [Caerostris darwini]|uniref:Uncharacterized protein n=1 Tax=Caerostris darwini TaxID=1538125 RepID=A0AAV4W7N1_9ARAC|nr:hypothetical protein CDAR_10881 [Caerostris darwini]
MSDVDQSNKPKRYKLIGIQKQMKRQNSIILQSNIFKHDPSSSQSSQLHPRDRTQVMGGKEGGGGVKAISNHGKGGWKWNEQIFQSELQHLAAIPCWLEIIHYLEGRLCILRISFTVIASITSGNFKLLV